jgi:hypothetical protein
VTSYREIEPYTTTDIPEAHITVFHDGDEEAAVRMENDGMLRLGATTGEWQVRVLDAKAGNAEEAN